MSRSTHLRSPAAASRWVLAALGVVVCAALGARLVSAASPDAGPTVVAEVAEDGRSVGAADTTPPALPEDHDHREIGVLGPRRPPQPYDNRVVGTRVLWFADDRWWALLPPDDGVGQEIFVLGDGGGWEPTGVRVDDRPETQTSVAYRDGRLAVAVTGRRGYKKHHLQVSTFELAASGSWTRRGDPIQVSAEGEPEIKAVFDGEGRLWLARLEQGQIRIAHSDPEVRAFTAFSLLPGTEDAEVGAFDLSARATAAVAWRSLHEEQLVLAESQGDPAEQRWSQRSVEEFGLAGHDLMDLEPGGPDAADGWYVAIDTNLGPRTSGGLVPSIFVLRLREDEEPLFSVAAQQRQKLTRPSLVVDPERKLVGLVAVEYGLWDSPRARILPHVVVKVATMADLEFEFGGGRLVVAVPEAGQFTMPVLPATPISAESGLVVAATGPDVAGWYTGRLDLGG